MQYHPIEPIYDDESTILILGSFPSVKSREAQFFYHHPQNRFWKILGAVFHDEVPQTIEQKKSFLHKHHIALWDVIASCEIQGSSDASIRQVTVNDLHRILESAQIEHIYTNGKLSHQYYQKYFHFEIPCDCLPSSSPANASYSLEKLIDQWKIISQ